MELPTWFIPLDHLIYTTSFIVSSKLKLLFIIKIMIEWHESKWKKRTK